MQAPPRVAVVSLVDISAGQELLMSYAHWYAEPVVVRCLCESPNCTKSVFGFVPGVAP